MEDERSTLEYFIKLRSTANACIERMFNTAGKALFVSSTSSQHSNLAVSWKCVNDIALGGSSSLQSTLEKVALAQMRINGKNVDAQSFNINHLLRQIDAKKNDVEGIIKVLNWLDELNKELAKFVNEPEVGIIDALVEDRKKNTYSKVLSHKAEKEHYVTDDTLIESLALVKELQMKVREISVRELDSVGGNCGFIIDNIYHEKNLVNILFYCLKSKKLSCALNGSIFELLAELLHSAPLLFLTQLTEDIATTFQECETVLMAVFTDSINKNSAFSVHCTLTSTLKVLLLLNLVFRRLDASNDFLGLNCKQCLLKDQSLLLSRLLAIASLLKEYYEKELMLLKLKKEFEHQHFYKDLVFIKLDSTDGDNVCDCQLALLICLMCIIVIGSFVRANEFLKVMMKQDGQTVMFNELWCFCSNNIDAIANTYCFFTNIISTADTNHTISKSAVKVCTIEQKLQLCTQYLAGELGEMLIDFYNSSSFSIIRQKVYHEHRSCNADHQESEITNQNRVIQRFYYWSVDHEFDRMIKVDKMVSKFRCSTFGAWIPLSMDWDSVLPNNPSLFWELVYALHMCNTNEGSASNILNSLAALDIFGDSKVNVFDSNFNANTTYNNQNLPVYNECKKSTAYIYRVVITGIALLCRSSPLNSIFFKQAGVWKRCLQNLLIDSGHLSEAHSAISYNYTSKKYWNSSFLLLSTIVYNQMFTVNDFFFLMKYVEQMIENVKKNKKYYVCARHCEIIQDVLDLISGNSNTYPCCPSNSIESTTGKTLKVIDVMNNKLVNSASIDNLESNISESKNVTECCPSNAAEVLWFAGENAGIKIPFINRKWSSIDNFSPVGGKNTSFSNLFHDQTKELLSEWNGYSFSAWINPLCIWKMKGMHIFSYHSYLPTNNLTFKDIMKSQILYNQGDEKYTIDRIIMKNNNTSENIHTKVTFMVVYEEKTDTKSLAVQVVRPLTDDVFHYYHHHNKTSVTHGTHTNFVRDTFTSQHVSTCGATGGGVNTNSEDTSWYYESLVFPLSDTNFNNEGYNHIAFSHSITSFNCYINGRMRAIGKLNIPFPKSSSSIVYHRGSLGAHLRNTGYGGVSSSNNVRAVQGVNNVVQTSDITMLNMFIGGTGCENSEYLDYISYRNSPATSPLSVQTAGSVSETIRWKSSQSGGSNRSFRISPFFGYMTTPTVLGGILTENDVDILYTLGPGSSVTTPYSFYYDTFLKSQEQDVLTNSCYRTDAENNSSGSAEEGHKVEKANLFSNATLFKPLSTLPILAAVNGSSIHGLGTPPHGTIISYYALKRSHSSPKCFSSGGEGYANGGGALSLPSVPIRAFYTNISEGVAKVSPFTQDVLTALWSSRNNNISSAKNKIKDSILCEMNDVVIYEPVFLPQQLCTGEVKIVEWVINCLTTVLAIQHDKLDDTDHKKQSLSGSESSIECLSASCLIYNKNCIILLCLQILSTYVQIMGNKGLQELYEHDVILRLGKLMAGATPVRFNGFPLSRHIAKVLLSIVKPNPFNSFYDHYTEKIIVSHYLLSLMIYLKHRDNFKSDKDLLTTMDFYMRTATVDNSKMLLDNCKYHDTMANSDVTTFALFHETSLRMFVKDNSKQQRCLARHPVSVQVLQLLMDLCKGTVRKTAIEGKEHSHESTGVSCSVCTITFILQEISGLLSKDGNYVLFRYGPGINSVLDVIQKISFSETDNGICVGSPQIPSGTGERTYLKKLAKCTVVLLERLVKNHGDMGAVLRFLLYAKSIHDSGDQSNTSIARSMWLCTIMCGILRMLYDVVETNIENAKYIIQNDGVNLLLTLLSHINGLRASLYNNTDNKDNEEKKKKILDKQREKRLVVCGANDEGGTTELETSSVALSSILNSSQFERERGDGVKDQEEYFIVYIIRLLALLVNSDDGVMKYFFESGHNDYNGQVDKSQRPHEEEALLLIKHYESIQQWIHSKKQTLKLSSPVTIKEDNFWQHLFLLNLRGEAEEHHCHFMMSKLRDTLLVNHAEYNTECNNNHNTVTILLSNYQKQCTQKEFDLVVRQDHYQCGLGLSLLTQTLLEVCERSSLGLPTFNVLLKFALNYYQLMSCSELNTFKNSAMSETLVSSRAKYNTNVARASEASVPGMKFHSKTRSRVRTFTRSSSSRRSLSGTVSAAYKPVFEELLSSPLPKKTEQRYTDSMFLLYTDDAVMKRTCILLLSNGKHVHMRTLSMASCSITESLVETTPIIRPQNGMSPSAMDFARKITTTTPVLKEGVNGFSCGRNYQRENYFNESVINRCSRIDNDLTIDVIEEMDDRVRIDDNYNSQSNTELGNCNQLKYAHVIGTICALLGSAVKSLVSEHQQATSFKESLSEMRSQLSAELALLTEDLSSSPISVSDVLRDTIVERHRCFPQKTPLSEGDQESCSDYISIVGNGKHTLPPMSITTEMITGEKCHNHIDDLKHNISALEMKVRRLTYNYERGIKLIILVLVYLDRVFDNRENGRLMINSPWLDWLWIAVGPILGHRIKQDNIASKTISNEREEHMCFERQTVKSIETLLRCIVRKLATTDILYCRSIDKERGNPASPSMNVWMNNAQIDKRIAYVVTHIRKLVDIPFLQSMAIEEVLRYFADHSRLDNLKSFSLVSPLTNTYKKQLVNGILDSLCALVDDIGMYISPFPYGVPLDLVRMLVHVIISNGNYVRQRVKNESRLLEVRDKMLFLTLLMLLHHNSSLSAQGRGFVLQEKSQNNTHNINDNSDLDNISALSHEDLPDESEEDERGDILLIFYRYHERFLMSAVKASCNSGRDHVDVTLLLLLHETSLAVNSGNEVRLSILLSLLNSIKEALNHGQGSIYHQSFDYNDINNAHIRDSSILSPKAQYPFCDESAFESVFIESVMSAMSMCANVSIVLSSGHVRTRLEFLATLNASSFMAWCKDNMEEWLSFSAVIEEAFKKRMEIFVKSVSVQFCSERQIAKGGRIENEKHEKIIVLDTPAIDNGRSVDPCDEIQGRIAHAFRAHKKERLMELQEHGEKQKRVVVQLQLLRELLIKEVDVAEMERRMKI